MNRSLFMLWILAGAGFLHLTASAAYAQEAFPAPAPGGTVDYVYKQSPQGPLSLTAHFPADWKPEDRRPAILFFFGGGWRNGTIAQFASQAAYLAGRGMVAFRCDYRVLNRQRTTPDACVEDAKSAVRWARRNAARLGIDPDRLVGSGGSAGGHIIACAALLEEASFSAPGEDRSVSCRPNALVLFNPALDLREREVLDAGGRNVAAEISPSAFVRAGIPPSIHFFGTADRMLGAAQAFVESARKHGVRAELHTAADQPHGFFNRSPWQTITLRQADRFLVSLGYLKGDATLPATEGEPALQKAP